MERVFSKIRLSDNNNAAEKSFNFQKLSLVIILVFVFLSSFGLWRLRLDFYSLWYDEANTVLLLQDKSMSEAFDSILATSGSETLHPLYYTMLAGWAQITGTSELSLRLPSVIFGSCAVVVYMLLLYQVGGNLTLPFGFLLIISPFLMWYSRDARPYSLIMFLTGLHMWYYLRLVAKPKSKKLLGGFIVTGVLSIYTGIFTGMILVAEFFWSFLIRRKIRETVAIISIIILASPLVWHGLQTHFVKSSDRYSELPKGMNAVRTLAIPQEFLVGRSLGPTPDEVRRLSAREIVHNKSLVLTVETLAIISIVIAFLVSFQNFYRRLALHRGKILPIQTLTFIIITCIAELTILVLWTGYRINARHVSFLFGPVFALSVLPIAYSNKSLLKVAFVLPLFLLWGWSCINQIFNSSYMTEDYRNAAKIIKSDTHGSSQILGLCHPHLLQYYGVDNPLIYFREGPTVTCDSLITCLEKQDNLSWIVLSRPWNYPNLRIEEMEQHFQILRAKHLPGVYMWLVALHD